jgi:hypothetical protein
MADRIQATPRNELLGLLADAMYGGLEYMKDPRRTQQMQGLAGLLESTGIPKTTERMAYGEDLTNIGRANVPLLKPETAEAIMTVAPMAKTAGNAAKGVARMYGSEINAAMMGERGGLLGAITPQPKLLDVYHGTPNRLPPTEANLLGEFDASKIGTGAGAQARGYGIYSSESPEFADYFAMRKKTPDVEGIALQNGLQLSRDAQVELMRQSTRDSMGKPAKGDNYIDPIAATKKLQNASIEARQMPAEQLRNVIRDFQEQNRAYLYKADLPDEMIPKMLDLDLPIKDQPMALKTIRQMIDDQDILKAFDNNVAKGITGENAAMNYVKGKTPAERSENLRKAGIPGNVYEELGVRNFVVYPGEEKRMKILERKTR